MITKYLFRKSAPLKPNIKVLVLLLFVFTGGACKQQTKELDRVLKLAGSNRPELEEVIDHYSQNIKDSLKLKAATFLISNMDVHFSYKSKIWDVFQMEMDTLFKHEDRTAELEQELERLYEKYGINLHAGLSYNSDLQMISSDFLIYNIDMAFENWNGPYASHPVIPGTAYNSYINSRNLFFIHYGCQYIRNIIFRKILFY